MQINGYQAYNYYLPQSNQVRGTRAGASSEDGSGAVDVKTISAADAFLAEAKKTPAERIRDEWLARHKMTKDDLNAMPPEQREAIEKEIAEELKRKLTGQDARRGAVMNMTA